MIALARTRSTSKVQVSAFQPCDLYKVRICAAPTGERIPLLVDAQSGLPVLRANQFILVARRDRCQVATLRSDLGVLTIVLGWARHQGDRVG